MIGVMKKEMKTNHEKMKEIKDKMKAELEKENPNKRTIHDYIKKMGSLRTNMRIKRMDSLLDMRKTLTPEQREKFKKMAKMRKKHGRRK